MKHFLDTLDALFLLIMLTDDDFFLLQDSRHSLTIHFSVAMCFSWRRVQVIFEILTKALEVLQSPLVITV